MAATTHDPRSCQRPVHLEYLRLVVEAEAGQRCLEQITKLNEPIFQLLPEAVD